MTGLCCVVGGEENVDSVASALEWTGEETSTSFEDDTLAIIGVFTSDRETDQPVDIGEDQLLWVWGSIFGVEAADGFRPRDRRQESTAAYCARLHDRFGHEFVSKLNGDFVGILYDRRAPSVSVFTDRLGLRDTYYVSPTEETLVFSTNIQSLSCHPSVTPAFDEELVTEYLTCNFRTFGVKTPLEDTFRFPPGAVTTIEIQPWDVRTRSYWEPHYAPEDRPYSYFVSEFSQRIRDAVNERIHPDREYGLLLSGGADSRLVLAAMDDSSREHLTAYHMAGWMSREARTAESVARTAGVDFRWLQRDREYHPRALERNPALSNFVGTFEQAHAEGFMPEVRMSCDEMITASFADSMFKGYSFPQYRIPLGRLGSVTLPVFKRMDGVGDYIRYWSLDPPPYLDSGIGAEEVLNREIYETDGGVVHHGIKYAKPRDLFTCGALTPRTNGSVLFILQSLRQHVPAWSPFADNRLVELYLSMPLRFFARRNVIRDATERLDPSLASLGNANTIVPISSPFAAHFAGDIAVQLIDRYVSWNDPPASYLTNNPWPDEAALMRDHPFVGESLRENDETLRRLPFLDRDAAWAMYREHVEGTADHQKALYGLLTLLEMPVTKRIARASS